MEKIDISNRIKRLTDKNVDELEKLYNEVVEDSTHYIVGKKQIDVLMRNLKIANMKLNLIVDPPKYDCHCYDGGKVEVDKSMKMSKFKEEGNELVAIMACRNKPGCGYEHKFEYDI